jgi:hypothetical protein
MFSSGITHIFGKLNANLSGASGRFGTSHHPSCGCARTRVIPPADSKMLTLPSSHFILEWRPPMGHPCSKVIEQLQKENTMASITL